MDRKVVHCCDGCVKREVGCHAGCPDYKKLKEYYEAVKEAKKSKRIAAYNAGRDRDNIRMMQKSIKNSRSK